MTLAAETRRAFGFDPRGPRRTRRAHRLPFGAEIARPDGYVLVKVPDGDGGAVWRPKQAVAYEEAFGPVPEGCSVYFGDGDRSNFDPSNLVAVPNVVRAALRRTGYTDAETLRSAVALAMLKHGVRSAEHSMPRPCAVCGRMFTETEAQRLYARPVQTCPECLAAGRQARGDRGDKRPTACRVCGRVFERAQRNQVRCPECIAAGRWVGVDDRRRKHGKG